MAEYAKKMDFMGKHRNMANVFNGDDRVLGIFGSYAKNSQKKGSDLDIFIIGDKRKEEFLEKGKLLDIDISIKYFSEKDFIRLIKEKNNLCKEMIKDHVLVNGSEHFINLVWRYYYGFD
jgi:predicted nucleotidyltransferase